MRPLLPALVALMITGGCTTPLPVVIPLERLPPELCLRPVQITQPCELPGWWLQATEADRAAIELNCKIVDAEAIRERDARLADCRAFFALE